jgi:hypothetical protein
MHPPNGPWRGPLPKILHCQKASAAKASPLYVGGNQMNIIANDGAVWQLPDKPDAPTSRNPMGWRVVRIVDPLPIPGIFVGSGGRMPFEYAPLVVRRVGLFYSVKEDALPDGAGT